ncbi:MAG TPA: ferritin-like domain-containing protein [Candidatus Binataceae bacterium]|nr:ferritin-like domain-containing protein [Candidatus Binataceae bacterium]
MSDASAARQKEALVLSFYRDAELHGARLLLNLHGRLRDADSQMKLTRHLADETRHAWLWTNRIAQLGAAPVAVADGYQGRLRLRVGIPKDELELLALTIIAETRALQRYRHHAAMPDVDRKTLEVLSAVTADETWHLRWVEEKMREIAERRGEPERATRILERYRALEREVYASLVADEAELMRV